MEDISGTCQFRLMKKLKLLKPALKRMNMEEVGDVKKAVEEIRSALDTCQNALRENPNPTLRDQEQALIKGYASALLREESLYKQKSRIKWLREGDQNTAYFLRSLCTRRNQNRISRIHDREGVEISDSGKIKEVAMNFFHNLLGDYYDPSDYNWDNMENFVKRKVPTHLFASLITPISEEEIKETVFSIHPNKAPGPDGYNSQFFRSAW